MSTTLMTEPAAGWYHDPADAGAWRWWDGTSWTDHVRPMSEVAVTTGSVDYQPLPTHAPVFEQQAPAPAAPAPAPAAEPPASAGPETIPQPGQAASAPAAAGSVPMTPTTPVSDQLYWHSSAAEVIEVPRVQHTPSRVGPRGGQNAPSYVRDWNDLGSPQTPGVWLLAFSPVIGVAVGLGLVVAMGLAGVSGIIPVIVGAVVALLLTWTFAAMDARSLGERGYHPPRLAWMLLFPPLAYLIARGKEVRRESKHAWGPELVFVLMFLLVGGVIASAVLVFASAVLALLPIAA